MNTGRCFRTTAASLLLAALCTAVPAAGLDSHQCGDCHDGSAGAAPSSAVCRECHRDIAGAAVAAGSRHFSPAPLAPSLAVAGGRATAEVDCLTCHDPHAAESAALLRVLAGGDSRLRGFPIDAASRLCLSCHRRQRRSLPGLGRQHEQHPVGIPVPDTSMLESTTIRLVDVEGTIDPADDVIGCTTCHNVHSSPGRQLLRWSTGHSREACCTCHDQCNQPRRGALELFARSKPTDGP